MEASCGQFFFYKIYLKVLVDSFVTALCVLFEFEF